MQLEKTVPTSTYTASEARRKFSDLFDAAHFGERVVVNKRDRSVAIVPLELLDRLERLMELEAALDSMKAEIALKEFQQKGGKTMEQIEQELGMT